MKSGERHQGYVVREDEVEVVLRDVAQDEQVRLPQSKIARRAPRGSAMPPGLTDTLTRAELRDLVCYLASLGKTADSPP